MYFFRGRLCGRICPDCPENLANVKLRVYRLRDDQDALKLATANAKQTFGLQKPAAVKKKQKSLIAETTTDAFGAFALEIGDDADYDGGAFEVDLVVERVPGQKGDKRKPVQFTVTTLQPQWREGRQGLEWGWDYCIPQRIWCWIRCLFGAWTICGTVEHCETGQPIGGVRVHAFDRDWVQDDALGDAITDGNGRFRIDYTAADFRPGTFIDVELIGGPDLYFRVETTGGVPLLVEAPSRGRDADRENASPCFCVDLCVEEVPDLDEEPPPVFLRVGAYNYATQINSGPGGDGLTSASGRAFYSVNRLNGVLPKKLNGSQMEYQFETRSLDATGNPTGPWTSLPLANVARTVIGDLLHFAPAFPGDPNPIKSTPYTVNGNLGEPAAQVVGGWIQVPQESSLFTATGFFEPNGNMVNLISTTLAPDANIDLTGLVTGNSVTSTGQPLVANHHYALRMRVREVGDVGPGQTAGTCGHIALNNTQYDNIRRHPTWMDETVSNQLGVCMVDIAQLQAAGCTEIGTDLDVVFTAAHPTLGGVTVYMTGPGGPYSFSEGLPPTPGDHFGTATPNFVVSDLDPCAYVVHLSVQVLLTTGDSSPNNLNDHVGFCKA